MLADRAAVEVPEVHRRQEQPAPAERAGDPRADVRVVDDQDAARLEQRRAALEHGLRIRRVLDDVPQRDDVEAAGLVGLIEDAALADADAVVPGAPVGEPGVRLAALRVPALLGGRRHERAGGGADVEQPSLAAGQPLDLAERRREGALAGRELRHVGRVVALGVAGEDEVVAEARVDVLELAAPALDEPVDQQLIAGRPEGRDEIGRILRIVARVVDDVGVVGAADGARDGLEEVTTRSHELSKRPSLASGFGRRWPWRGFVVAGLAVAQTPSAPPAPRAQPPVLGVDGAALHRRRHAAVPARRARTSTRCAPRTRRSRPTSPGCAATGSTASASSRTGGGARPSASAADTPATTR